MKMTKQERYLRAKEVMNCTITLGMILERANLDDEDKEAIEEVLDKLSQMFYDEYYELREDIEPDNIQFHDGMRYQ